MSETLIRAAREHWSLGDAEITLVAARENRVYRVCAATQCYALRLHRPGYRSIAEVHAEFLWMEWLAEHGLSVPAPIKSFDDCHVKSFSGTLVDLLTWVEGVPLSHLTATEAHYHGLGVLLAQMHALADQWQPPEAFVRHTWDLVGEQPSWGRFWENPQLTPAQQQQLRTFREAAGQRLEALPAADIGLIHADLVPDNVLYHHGKLTPIDFDDGGYGYRLFDVATVTLRSYRMCDDDRLAQAAVDGYCSLRPLDRQSLQFFEALRACSYIGWNISRMNEEGATKRNRRFIAEAQAAIGRAEM